MDWDGKPADRNKCWT